jgi:hypothetical protein
LGNIHSDVVSWQCSSVTFADIVWLFRVELPKQSGKGAAHRAKRIKLLNLLAIASIGAY